ncbi:type V toxin-antitoxin system endoribonuclease antitoxin GhoS [Pantoea sp. BAV 3049]|uniref:type V toxin-antitoxin system endoribonuclease antitoxin GhoS n=1 Tax=Pantoea sp. BAV 3049 TaxID=2654188 RepID=UPI00131A610B|nr:type V toxin-antitoxin system endoribonuclease antitoxin GhoS [Pantoea sp. BAV 3049]
MSTAGVTQYVVTFRYQEEGLSDILELNSALTAGGFLTALSDKEGHPHELGTNSFGIVSAQEKEKIREQAESIGEMVLGVKPEVEVQSWDEFKQEAKN